MFDNKSSGGFTSALLDTVRDELPKKPILAFPILSGLDPSSDGFDEVCLSSHLLTGLGLILLLPLSKVSFRNTILQDSLCLKELNESATQVVTLQDPSSWTSGSWNEYLRLSVSS